jgi:prepilin-type N-terminal cleavage/methylation domain-containing protein
MKKWQSEGARRGRRAFSLVEMLVVIVIIAILTGMVIKVQSLVAERTARAQTIKRLENIKLILEEYYRAYGEYPPQVNEVAGDPPGTALFGSPVDDYFGHATEFESLSEGEHPEQWEFMRNALPQSTYTGLVYHITSDGRFSFADLVNGSRWAEFFNRDVGLGQHYRGYAGMLGSREWGVQAYTNTLFFLQDGWWRQFVYMCDTNNGQSYVLYSKGPDGQAQRDAWGRDDIGRKGFAE